MDSIEQCALISHTTVTKTIQSLEDRQLISVARKENQHHLIKELRESNTYILLEEQPS